MQFSNLEMYHSHYIVNQFVQSGMMKFHIFSNLFDFQRLGSTSINE